MTVNSVAARKVFVALIIALFVLNGCTVNERRNVLSNTSHPLDEQQLGFSTMLVVRELSKSEEFYVKHFGFRVTERLEALRRLERDGVTLYLVTESPPTPDKPGVTLAPQADLQRPSVNLIFRVSDVRATYQSLKAGGLVFLTPPQQPPWGGWRCFAQDPDGYLIEIEQP
jgi:catechol 2,3-dioxygenase-like lactoylglutathione lyase family enzyme